MTVSILAQRPTAAPAATHIIDTHDLSAEARDYLRHGLVRSMLDAGASKCSASGFANLWAIGYRSFAKGMARSQWTGAALEGWEYAHGEDAWWHCQIVDAAQDSADACNYGWR